MDWLSCINVPDDVKITCVTVTKNRLTLLKRSIQCYINQTYVNKELLIASQDNNKEIEEYIKFLNRKDIRLIDVSNLSLGKARKIACWNAYGDIVCQWDDDDIYHPKRLSNQYNQMIRDQALVCYYDSHLKYFENNKELYWVDWSIEQGEPWHKCLGGSVMFFKKYEGRYLEIVNFYPDKEKYEDVDFAEKAFKNYPVAISKDGYQYVYVYHGDNVYDYNHHRDILNSKYVYTKEQMCKNYSHICSSISILDHDVKIMGSDGLLTNYAKA